MTVTFTWTLYNRNTVDLHFFNEREYLTGLFFFLNMVLSVTKLSIIFNLLNTSPNYERILDVLCSFLGIFIALANICLGN